MIPFLLTACFPQAPDRDFPPMIVSVSPVESSVVNYGENVLFSIQVEDPDTPLRELSIRLESTLNGVFIEGTPDDNGILNQSTNELLLGEHMLTVTVSDTGGNVISQPSSLYVNALPEISDVSIEPTLPSTRDDLEVLIAHFSDVDGDGVQIDYQWYRNGELQDGLDDATLSAEFTQKGEIWSVEVTPYDESGMGAFHRTSTVIQNTVPKVDSVSISPSSEVLLGTPLTCTANGSDPDGDVFDTSYTWKILSNGNFYDVEFGTDTFVPEAPLVQPNDQLRCTVQLVETDGAASIPMNTMVSIENRLPEIQDVLVYAPSGEGVRAGTTLECTVMATDLDQSELHVDYVWMNGNSVLDIQRGLSLDTNSQLTLSSGNAVRGDTIVCDVTVTDGSGGEVQSESSGSVVVNTPPDFQSVGIIPSYPTTQDNITCIPVAQDIDGDVLSYEFTWTINGNVVQTGLTDTLLGPFASSDQITCDVTVSDGQGIAATLDTLTSSVSVVNTPPEIVDISLSPAEPTVNDVLTATVVASDLDSDPILLHYEWFVDGISVKSAMGGNTLNGELYYLRNQQVYVIVTPEDVEDTGLPVLSDVISTANAAPTLNGAEILPQQPVPTVDDIQCVLSEIPNDVDGDDLTIVISWTQNGQPYVGGLNETVYPNDTVPGVFTQDGEQWACTVEVMDDTLSHTVESSPVDVLCLNGYGDIEACPATSCYEIIVEQPLTYSEDGLYWLDPDGAGAYEAYCDMTHDGGGWTLLMRALGSDDTLDYDAIYWESAATINDGQNQPNVDVNGVSAKFEAYNSVEGTTLRLSFVEPIQHNIHYYDLGTCSDGVSKTLDACIGDGVCDSSQWDNETDCLTNGTCDDTAYTNQSDCESNGQMWTPFVWQSHVWADGLTALELFSGPEIMLQGVVLGYSGGCRGGLLTQDFIGEMQFVYQSQFFGINGYNHSTSGSTSANRYSKVRFGYGSGIDNTLDAGWGPQIGIGTHVRYYKFLQYDYTNEHSTAWLDPDATNTCGTYGNGIGAAAEDAVSNLWIR